MSIYLINGVSGTGKSSVGTELRSRGFNIVDTDKEFGYHANLSNQQPVDFPGKNVREGWYEGNGWIWNEERAMQSLDDAATNTFFVGGARNEHVFYSKFQTIFQLITDPEIMVNRLKNRGDVNSSNPHYIARMLHLMNDPSPVDPLLHFITINTSTKSIVNTTDELLSHLDLKYQ